MAEITVGQKLYQPPRHRSTWREFTVAKIGRKWITFTDENRCTIDSLLLDCGGYAPQQLYITMEEYEAAAKAATAWRELVRDLSSMRCPAGATEESIRDARKALMSALGEVAK